MRIAGFYPQEVSRSPQGEVEFFEPLGLEYVLTQVAEENDVSLFTLFDRSEGQVTQDIIDFSPDVLAISAMTSQINMGLRIADKVNKARRTLTVFGGYHPNYDFNSLLQKPDASICIRGEGEKAFRSLIYALTYGEDFREIPGLVYSDRGGIHKNPVKRISNLDSLADTIRPEFLGRLRNNGLMYPAPSEQTGMATVLYSRGCKFSCNFCASPGMYGQGVSYRSPRRVVQELRRLRNKGINTFLFADLNITADKQRTIDLCDRIIDSGVEVYWEALSNISTADDADMLKKMYEAGCGKIAWGIESFNPGVLNDMGKPIDQTQTYQVLQKAESCGILNTGFYILGHPEEDAEMIRGYLSRLVQLPLHRVRFTVYTPLPGSKLFDKSHDLDRNWDNYDTTHLVFPHRRLTQQNIDELRAELTEKFYASQQHQDRIGKMIDRFPEYKKSFAEAR